ncbi:hypothetical protein TWF481_005287 [Arthrobotrys musiformis]|uniref:Uncharacterized protein n=1 Tax=Arthrobotrys musiformis TaxID=47236 RepID=A0AAV9WF15_9PEZI
MKIRYAFQLSLSLSTTFKAASGRFIRFVWENGIKSTSHTDVYDIDPAWMNTKCLNLPTPDAGRGLVRVEYYSGPPVNPYHPYFLSTLIIFNALDCPPPARDLRWHYLPVENMDEAELEPRDRPKWLRDPDAVYEYTKEAEDTATVEFPEFLEDVRVDDDGGGKEPHWIDYTDSEAYSIDVEKMRVGVSRGRGEEYVNELAKSLRDLDGDEGYRGGFGDSAWDVVYSAVGSGEEPFWGNVSVIFVPEYRYRHVLGVAREFDEYARGGEGVGGAGLGERGRGGGD